MTLVIAASFVSSGAAAEGTTPVLPQAQALPEAAAVAAEASAIATAVVAVAESAMVETHVAHSPEPTPAVPAEPASAEAAPPPVEMHVAEPQTPDTTPDPVDTAEDEALPAMAVSPDEPATVATPASQVRPVNVNVSVRVESPGNDGAVAQLNVSQADSPVTVLAPGSAPALTGPAAKPAVSAAAAPAVSGQLVPDAQPLPNGETWTWTWGCDDSGPGVSLSQLPPGGSIPANWNWNWDWNCGGEDRATQNIAAQSPGQYQTSTRRYQPVNINVSIRIGSPGDNGPVVQANLAVATVATVAAVSAATAVAEAATIATAAVAAVFVPPEPSSSSALDDAPTAPPMEPMALVELTGAVAATVLELVWGDEVVELEMDRPVRGRSIGLLSSPPDRAVVVRRTARRIPDAAATPVVMASVWTHSVSAPARKLPGAAARPPAASAHAKRALVHPPVRLPSEPERVPAAAMGLGGIGPSSGGDGGFLLLLLIPFAFAFADTARRVTRGVSGVVAQVESSRRERPG
ncbi:MAG: hypothetical protein MSC30_02335 [Gaiellaceae bacterium MAG52_C11]|nr:hypothetical protein [Candidatus Gaiellasilicea maunaloa]